MKKCVAITLCTSLALLSCSGADQLEVEDVWSRDTVGRTANAAVFMTISSPSPDRLISASTPIAKRTDLMTMTGGTGSMGMDYVKAIDIPAGRLVSFNPSGLHVWLTGLHKPLKAEKNFPLTLQFEKGGRRTVTVTVIAPTAPPPVS